MFSTGGKTVIFAIRKVDEFYTGDAGRGTVFQAAPRTVDNSQGAEKWLETDAISGLT